MRTISVGHTIVLDIGAELSTDSTVLRDTKVKGNRTLVSVYTVYSCDVWDHQTI